MSDHEQQSQAQPGLAKLQKAYTEHTELEQVAKLQPHETLETQYNAIRHILIKEGNYFLVSTLEMMYHTLHEYKQAAEALLERGAHQTRERPAEEPREQEPPQKIDPSL